jgi:hypothetical protein
MSASMDADRPAWIAHLDRVCSMPLAVAAARRLRAEMPVEQKAAQVASREPFTRLELVARILTGIARWLEADAPPAEKSLQASLRIHAREAIASLLDPASPDVVDFDAGHQCIVDAAFLAQAVLHAPTRLWSDLDESARRRLIEAITRTRGRAPWFSNWLLFSAMIETLRCRLGLDWDRMRVDYAIRQHLQWYVGDSAYGDGPRFHFDYYNSFVIQPMLLDVMEVTGHLAEHHDMVLRRATRYAQVLERSISPEGAIPVIGRSLSYRTAAMQHLAFMAARRQLPAEVAPAQVRCGLAAVMHRLMNASRTFDDAGWLRIGFCGAQPDLGENYISTGSLYLCSTVFHPLGLSADDPFWASPPQPWTSAAIYSGLNVSADHALHD